MPTSKQERDRSRRKLQEQLERRRAAEARRRKTTIGVTVVATLVVIGVALALVIGIGGNDSTPSAAGSSSAPVSASESASTADQTTSGPCAYTSKPANGNQNITDVGLPPDPTPSPTDNRTVVFSTAQGDITMELDAAAAPCNVQSVAFLAQTGFYDNTSCHRLVTSGIFVLQCGDPSGTGSGGPAYAVKDENLTASDYSQGVVAMANSGADTNSSQFFIMTADSNAGLAKSYTVIGKVTAGLDIVEAVAAAGTADGSTDGKPKSPLTFTTVTVTPPLDLGSASASPTDGVSSSETAPAGVSSPADTGIASGSPIAS